MDVQFGDIWRIGAHIYACGDIAKGHNAELVERCHELTGGGIAMVHTDPPWNAGIAKMFRTQLEGKSDRKVDFRPLHDAVTDPLPNVDVYLETGKKHHAEMPTWFEEQGYTVLKTWETAYAAGPMWLFHLHRSPKLSRVWSALDEPDPAGTQNWALPLWSIKRSTQPGELVYDCCMGLGGTAVAAHRSDRVSMGLELVPKRAAKGIAILAKLTGLRPTKAGTLRA